MTNASNSFQLLATSTGRRVDANMRESHILRCQCSNCFLGKSGDRGAAGCAFLACAGLVAAGLLMGGGIASADSGLGGLGIGHEKDNDNKPRNDADQTPVSRPIVRIGAREDRGGFEVGPGGIRISRQPGFRGGFDIRPDGPRLTIDERGISGAFNLGPSGSRVTFGRAWSGGPGASREKGNKRTPNSVRPALGWRRRRRSPRRAKAAPRSLARPKVARRTRASAVPR